MIPYSGTDISSCGPIPPGYYQNSQRQDAPIRRWISKWGAIAADGELGILGTKIKADTRQEAEEAAMSDCKSKGASIANYKVYMPMGVAAWLWEILALQPLRETP
jgi:hypothetical protein